MTGIKRRKGHVCPNAFHGEGARGGCYFEIADAGKDGIAHVDVGWSCVVVHQRPIPISWLAELVAIATAHKGGIVGFLQEHNYGGGYALMCNPPEKAT